MRKILLHRVLPLTVVTSSMGLLGACGGGTSGGSVAVVPTPTPTPTATVSAEAVEYARSNAAVASNADAAYRAGATGRGIMIAVIDTGIAAGLSEFANRIAPTSADMAGNRGLIDSNGHGTAISAVALAARDGHGIHGVAFEASLLSLNISRPDTCTPAQCHADNAAIVRAIDTAIAAGARVINLSFGADDAEPEWLDAIRRAAAAGIVIVVSAGNEPGGTEPRALARAIVDAGGGLVIVAGTHDATGQAYSGGNRAGTGSAAAVYLCALGTDVSTIRTNGSTTNYSGASLSTAAISGAVALVAQARPRLSGAQITALLLGNATDAGTPGNDAVYGRGILNLAKVFAAIDN